ncbi:OmpP1/FadL family transporter [Acinetobacter towneri]|uniref:OmpP1/FadL family transporter n=1 Tax=Acinetobacter towneri TaxID=202956 RepID=UPI002935FCFE|nr:outer membrane protein transport protein [Acinetobacter towneri]MDV2454334.1 outer membrane protein transport protein [Acinetobacter towneri]
MKLKALSTAMILATVPMTGAFAAAMDRSGQSIAAFLQPGNYFEAGISVLDADVSGRSTPLAPGLPSQDTGDMASDYYFPAAALKLQLTDNFSFGLLYDQPFGADVDYNTPNLNFTDAFGGTSAEVTTENLTFLFGFQPNQNWNFYAGPVIQTAEGEVSLRGLAYGGPTAFGSYDATMKKDTELGWIAGLAYQIPEIALKASLTYRSEVKHELQATETVNYGQFNLASNPLFTPGKTSVTTPQSVNLDFQTGVMADTVAFANVRWVNWEDFSIRPNYFGQAADARGLVGANLVDYSDDQISATLGVGRKFNEKWAGNVSVGWDSGAGDPVTTLGPTEGYWNVGLGLQFSPATNYFIAGGVKYFMLGDATAKTAAVNNVGTFEDNDAWGYGLKMGYRF